MVSRATLGVTEREQPWQAALLAVGAVALFPAASWIVPGWVTGSSARVVAHAAVQIGLALALVALALRVAGAGRLGLRRPDLATLGWGLAGLLASLLGGGIAIGLAHALGSAGQSEAEMARLTAHPAWVLLLIALTAGLTEEIAFRGVLIDRLARLAGGRTWLGAALSLGIFAGLHANAWGPVQVLLVIPPGLAMTLVFLRTRDLGACVLAHALTDAIGLLSYGMR